ncbi:hypothetical protein [Vallitalea guaymasensis]|uniref:hypothetical protein n=1 Tax=Vallitalea guaymasensis TaxID=1185412 RepID=UPI00272B91BC|nr:hypothetical protein [Vallitalea guaymasensis]
MRTKLILVEGLPSSGKSTIAEITDEILNEIDIERKLFKEGNLDHPADYDGVACFNHKEYNELIAKYNKYSQLIQKDLIQKGNDYFLPYAKLLYDTSYPSELINDITKYDIYELSLDRHIDLILKKWEHFVHSVIHDKFTYIFECCFMQNPITVSMLRDNSPKEKTINYIKRLAKIIEPLNPILLYVNQKDFEMSFKKVLNERPESWLKGFIDYYTNRGFGKENEMNGIEGTIEVLRARKKLELEIFYLLKMDKWIIDNSSYDFNNTKNELMNIITKHYNK